MESKKLQKSNNIVSSERCNLPVVHHSSHTLLGGLHYSLVLLRGRGAFTGFVPQIVPDKVSNIFHFIEVFTLFFAFWRFFFGQIAKGRRPTLTLTLTQAPTLTQARAPTRARLRRAF